MQIALQNIHKEFARRDGARLLVLRDVSLTVGAEEFCCLVGASGSGKSTLLNILAGLTSPDAGQVLVGDSRLDSRRPRIGYVFQTPRLLNWKSVADNVAFAVRAAGVPADQARARARQYLGLVGSISSSMNSRSRCPEGCSSGWPSPVRSPSSRTCS